MLPLQLLPKYFLLCALALCCFIPLQAEETENNNNDVLEIIETVQEKKNEASIESENKSLFKSLEEFQAEHGDIIAAEAPIAFIHIDGEINPLQLAYVERSLKKAQEGGAKTLITYISSFGGRVDSAYYISKELLKVSDDMRTISFVDGEAISAGALIAYSHEELYLTDNSVIGDIGVIFQNAEGQVEFASEKFETLVRNHLNALSEKFSWNSAFIQKMTAISQTLYEITLEDGTYHVLENDLDIFLRDYNLQKKDKRITNTKWRDGILMTLTCQEANRFGMASGEVNDREDLLNQLGTSEEELISLVPDEHELLSRSLATIAPMLAGLAFVFLIFELKTPGVGIFLGISVLCGLGFLFCQYYLNLVSNVEIILIFLGVALILIDAFTMFTGGILIAVGAIISIIGLFMSYMPESGNYEFNETEYAELTSRALINSTISVGIACLGVMAFIFYLPKTVLADRIAVKDNIEGHSGGKVEKEKELIIGKLAECKTELAPNGTIIFQQTSYSARSQHGNVIPAGSWVKIEDIQFGEFIVSLKEKKDSFGDVT